MSEPLLDRLLLDAEARAVRGESREALLLLRWAGTIASRPMMPRVLLAFHRVRALHPMSDPSASAPASEPQVESDHLGFPVPRFAVRPPELDRIAFVPARRLTPERWIAADGEGATPPRLRPARGTRRRWIAVLLSLVVVSVAGALPKVRRAESGGPTTAHAAAALRAGNPREAMALLERIPNRDARALLVWGNAQMALADTLAAAQSFRKAAEHPDASADDVLASARALASLPCCVSPAADAYLRAYERGIPDHRVPEIARHLERAGRQDQAMRIRELGIR